MTFKVTYAPGVYEDLQQAIYYYNSRKKGLGSRFLKAIKVKTSQIKSNAYSFQIRYNDIRCTPIDKFPYTVHYRIFPETGTIIIVSILSDDRNP